MLTVSHTPTPGTHSFWGHDSHARYLEYVNTSPANWYYRKHTVEYKINSQNYRAPEFSTVDWAESIVLLGDELAWGQGITELDALHTKLSIHTERRVINLSQPGASAEWIWAQALDLPPHYLTIILWPDPTRWTDWSHSVPQHQGHWTHNPTPYSERITRSQFVAKSTQQLYPKAINWTLAAKWSWLYNAQSIEQLNTLDRSRCGSIPGRQALDLLARELALAAAKR